MGDAPANDGLVQRCAKVAALIALVDEKLQEIGKLTGAVERMAQRILIIDDDVDLAARLGHVLRLEGYVPLLAFNPREGLELCRIKKPDLVVLDYFLPEMTGQELLPILRADGNVPIIMLTANALEQSIVACLELGADDYVMKPFRPRQLIARIRALLRRRRIHPPVLER